MSMEPLRLSSAARGHVTAAAGPGAPQGSTYTPHSQQYSGAFSHHQPNSQQAHIPYRRGSYGSGSGLQSPPYEEQEETDSSLRTDELKSTLFGSVTSQQQANTGGIAAAAGMGTAAASAASSGGLRQQVLQQLRSKQDKPANAAPGHDQCIAAYHQQAPEPFAGFGKGQDVPHNARLWRMPLSPKLAAEFSLHNNPLAEQHSVGPMTGSKAASTGGVAIGSLQGQRQQLPHETSFEHVLSLSELASIDPSQL